MEEQKEEQKQKHEHSFYPVEIYELGDFYYVIVKLECECGEIAWDIGDKIDLEA